MNIRKHTAMPGASDEFPRDETESIMDFQILFARHDKSMWASCSGYFLTMTSAWGTPGIFQVFREVWELYRGRATVQMNDLN